MKRPSQETNEESLPPKKKKKNETNRIETYLNVSPKVKKINFYKPKDNYGCFSNFYKRSIIMDEKSWKTTEHYFQGQKFKETKWEDNIRNSASAWEVSQLGRRRDLPLRKDWEIVKDEIMFKCVLAKFTQHSDLKKILLDTKDSLLVEHTEKDKYWGDGGDGTGKNMLGKTLMKVRKTLQNKN